MPGVEDGSGFILLSVPQSMRAYTYPGGHELMVENVVKIRHAGGYEYLETAGGEQVIAAPGWLAMHGTPAAWVFRP